MKKIIQNLGLFLIVGMLFSCATTSQKDTTYVNLNSKPVYNMDSANVMDSYWDKYFQTGDAQYIEKVMAYTNTEDLLVKKINEKMNVVSKDVNFMLALDYFGADIIDGKVSFGYDFELLTGFILTGENKDYLNYIFSYFSDDVLIRAVMKSTAFWSLCSNASQDEKINIEIQKRIPFLLEDVQYTYYSFLDLKKEIGYEKSTNGIASYSDKDIVISVILVNDMKKTLNDWNTLKEEEAPTIKSTCVVNKENNFIAPFIVYNVSGKVDYPIYFDCELIEVNGTKSDVVSTKMSFAKKDMKRKDLMFTTDDNFAIGFEESDPKGEYILRISVYSKNTVISVFDMTFTLK